jgi:putative phosphoribosyl transferase
MMNMQLTGDVSTLNECVPCHGDMVVPRDAKGLVIFVHGSHDIAHSAQNQLTARRFAFSGLATLFVDLLDPCEARECHNLFDPELLADRLLEACRWYGQDKRVLGLPLGCYGTGTGAAVALTAAAREPSAIAAVVARAGRPDLASSWLHLVRAPTLLIVGDQDPEVLHWNREALPRLQAAKEMIVVPGAGTIFEEGGAAEEAARHARRWFLDHFGKPAGRPAHHFI